MDDGGNNSLSLLRFFVDTFSIQEVYNLGWYAAREWMLVITGVLVAIALAIRLSEERIAAFSSKGNTDWPKVFTNVVLVAMAIALYFTLAGLVIDFFNAIYGVMDSTTMRTMAETIDGITAKLYEMDLAFNWSILYESVYIIFSMLAFAVSYAMLIFMTFAMRLAHAMLVSFLIFWGAVALPMSITTGLKQLQPFKTLCILALIWPIVDAFLMYLVGGAFMAGLDDANLQVGADEALSTSKLLFYLVVLSIINLFLIATTFSAPFIAQGLANGTGNVTGLIGSFGAAGLAAGAVAGGKMMESFNHRGGQLGRTLWGKDADSGGRGLLKNLSRGAWQGNAGPGSGGSGAAWSGSAPAGAVGVGSGASSFKGAGAGGAETPSGGESLAKASQKGAAPASGGEDRPTGGSAGAAKDGPERVGQGGMTEQEQIQQDRGPADDHQGDLGEQDARERAREKQKKQARRGAIIQQQKKGK